MTKLTLWPNLPEPFSHRKLDWFGCYVHGPHFCGWLRITSGTPMIQNSTHYSPSLTAWDNFFGSSTRCSLVMLISTIWLFFSIWNIEGHHLLQLPKNRCIGKNNRSEERREVKASDSSKFHPCYIVQSYNLVDMQSSGIHNRKSMFITQSLIHKKQWTVRMSRITN